MSRARIERPAGTPSTIATSPGPCRVAFQLQHADGSVATLEAEQRIRPDAALVKTVREMCGSDAVEVLN